MTNNGSLVGFVSIRPRFGGLSTSQSRTDHAGQSNVRPGAEYFSDPGSGKSKQCLSVQTNNMGAALFGQADHMFGAAGAIAGFAVP
jgi:hypothetical protein